METAKNVFDQYGKLMDQEIVAVQLGCYSVALIGLSAAIRKVRPFARFKKPKDIPKLFIQEKRELTGLVKRIDPNGGLLMIEHKPLISLPIVPKGELPVKILGVKVSGLGISWLQSIVVDSEVTFIPVKKDSDFVQCEVLLPNKKPVVRKVYAQNRDRNMLKRLLEKKEEPFLNVGECLVKVGFAEISPIEKAILKENNYEHYLKSLQSAELYAMKRKLGIKYYLNFMTNILNALLLKSLNSMKAATLKVIMNIQNLLPKTLAT